MTDKEQFKAEIEKVKLIIQSNRAQGAFAEWYLIGQESVLEHFVNFVNSMQEEPVIGLDNGDMSIERWKQAVKAASNQRNYRSSKGLTETRDDYFVDGVQWADEHPKEEPVSEDLEEAAKHYLYSNILYDDVYVGNPTDRDCIEMFKAGANWQFERVNEALLSKVLPCFMHGGEADEVVAKLDEVLNQKK